jgi:GNAT superfamily N-acetyltransferase
MSGPVVRVATRADCDFMVAAVRELAAYEKLLDQCVVEPASLARDLFGPRPFAEALIGEIEGKAAGYALFFHNYSTFLGKPGLFLEDLIVLPERRGQGLGRALLAAVAGLAVERGCGRLDWNVLAWNEPAVGFYRGLGAEIFPDWRSCRLEATALERVGREAPGRPAIPK